LVLPPRHGLPGMVELRLITGEKSDSAYPHEWVGVAFRGDPRLSAFRPVKRQRVIAKGKRKGDTAAATSTYEFFDRHLGKARASRISGVKLLFRLRRDGTPTAAYLYFTCNIEDEPVSLMAKAIKWTETGEITRKGKKRKNKTLPADLVSAAIDLGIRNLGFATLARHEDGAVQVLRSRNLWVGLEEPAGRHPGRWAAGPDLFHIARHKRRLRFLRRKRGKPVKGETSHVELQEHLDSMGEDRFKRMARAIINFALNGDGACNRKTGEVHPRADLLILETLESIIPDAEKERGINRALVAWNRGHLVQRIREMAEDSGLKVFEISPVGTSQVCSKCGALGRRYSLVNEPVSGQQTIRFGWVEKLFACPNDKCRYRANSDHNASVNLHRRFAAGDAAVKGFLDWRTLSEARRKESVKAIEERLNNTLRPAHGLEQAPPF